jgi:hypothetical protein
MNRFGDHETAMLECITANDLKLHTMELHVTSAWLLSPQEEFCRLELRLHKALTMLLTAMGVEDHVRRYASKAECALTSTLSLLRTGPVCPNHSNHDHSMPAAASPPLLQRSTVGWPGSPAAYLQCADQRMVSAWSAQF